MATDGGAIRRMTVRGAGATMFAGGLALWLRGADADAREAVGRIASFALLFAPALLVVFFSFSSGGFFPDSVALADVAVAAVDGAGNVGPLSNVVCGEPGGTSDGTGAEGGGASCTVGRLGAPVGAIGIEAIVVGSLVGFLRRKRRSRAERAP